MRINLAFIVVSVATPPITTIVAPFIIASPAFLVFADKLFVHRISERIIVVEEMLILTKSPSRDCAVIFGMEASVTVPIKSGALGGIAL